MLDPVTHQRLETWVTDFCHGDGLAGEPPAVCEAAPGLLLAWLEEATTRAGGDPDELTAATLREALITRVAPLDLAAGVHARVPTLARDLLASLEQEGRLEDGRELGLMVAAGGSAYARAAAGQVEPLDRPGPKVGRNDPCPCGSGRKFKRCCMRAA